MELDDGTKLILLPAGYSSFDIISLPSRISKKKVLATADQLFELREVHGSSDYDAHPEPKLPSGEAVKSIILERKDSPQGVVLKSPVVVTCTPFNIAYYVLNAMYEQKDVYASRFHTVEDILDSLHLSPCHKTVSTKIEQCLDLICSTIEENGDHYYKFLMQRAFYFIQQRVERLELLVKNSPDFVLTGMITASLCTSGDTPASEVVDLQTTKYCIDMIFGSYLSGTLKKRYLDYALIDLSPLDSYFKEIESKKRALAAIEENMESVVLVTQRAKTKNSKSKTITKKPVNKVAVGKGALDSFFRKA